MCGCPFTMRFTISSLPKQLPACPGPAHKLRTSCAPSAAFCLPSAARKALSVEVVLGHRWGTAWRLTPQPHPVRYPTAPSCVPDAYQAPLSRKRLPGPSSAHRCEIYKDRSLRRFPAVISLHRTVATCHCTPKTLSSIPPKQPLFSVSNTSRKKD